MNTIGFGRETKGRVSGASASCARAWRGEGFFLVIALDPELVRTTRPVSSSHNPVAWRVFPKKPFARYYR
jgi:hypothetical protein